MTDTNAFWPETALETFAGDGAESATVGELDEMKMKRLLLGPPGFLLRRVVVANIPESSKTGSALPINLPLLATP